MESRNIILKVGRPKGTVKDPNRLKIINPNGRKIDVNGVQYNKLSKKYYYNPEKNEFYKYVNDPKKPDIKLDVTGEEVKKYEKRGYLFDKEKNIIISPGKMTESAKNYTLFDYDLHIVNDQDPLIQMKLLGTREEVIIKRALKKHKGVTFNTSMDIEFIKNDGEVKNTFTFTPKLVTINSKCEISSARQTMNKHINGMIDRYTNQGSEWVINRIMRHFISVNKYLPLAAKSYIKLPPKIQNKIATINIQNKHNKFFIYFLSKSSNPNPEKEHLERVSKHLRNVCIELGLEEKLRKLKIK